MKPSEALTVHREELRRLVTHYGLMHPRVFGSVANWTDTNESDLDLLVEPGRSTSLLTLAGQKRCGKAIRSPCFSFDSKRIAAEVSERGAASGTAPVKHPARY